MFRKNAAQRGRGAPGGGREDVPAGQGGGILGWLIMSFFLVAVVLVVGGLLVFHNIKVRQAGNEVNVDTPFGSVHVQHGDNGRPASLGIPLYPGSTLSGKGETANVDFSEIFGDKDLHIVAGKWETSDPIDKVQKYYEDKFPDMSVIQHNTEVEMHSVDRRGKRVIVLRSRHGATEISLASVGEPKAN
ncbi:MAG TPA: hypothetical protein VGL72_06515 [Bryobacteraceae bacterium]|jgi:hypothetical protein